MARPRPLLPPVTSARRGTPARSGMDASERISPGSLHRGPFAGQRQAAQGNIPGVTAIPRETSRWEVPARPRWYTHGYNRAELYRLATILGWLPRPVRLALARHIARLAPRLVPAE